MPRYRRRERDRATKLWRDALPKMLAVERARVRDAEDIPDAVLLAEAEHHFEPANLWPAQQWFTRRLKGEANTAESRAALAAELQELPHRRDHRPWGLLKWPHSMYRSRRRDPPRRPVDSGPDS